MPYIDQYKYMETISLHNPKFLINYEDVMAYLGTYEAYKKFSEADCKFVICDVNLRRERAFLPDRVVEFINEAFNDKPANYTFDKEELRDILEVRKLFVKAHGFLESFDKELLRSNLKKGLATILKRMLIAYQEKRYQDFWDDTPRLRLLLLQGVKNIYFYQSDIEKLYNFLSPVYNYMIEVWEKEFNERETFDLNSSTTINSFFKSNKETVNDVNLYMPFVSLKLEWAYLQGKLDEEFEKIKEYFEESGNLTPINRSILISTKLRMKREEYRVKDIIFSLLSIGKGFSLDYGYPIPDGFERKSLIAVTHFIAILSDRRLIENCVEAYVTAHLGVAEDLPVIKTQILATLTYNANLLREYGIITKEQQDAYVEQGRKRYYERS